jgi:hypothetical protein
VLAYVLLDLGAHVRVDVVKLEESVDVVELLDLADDD